MFLTGTVNRRAWKTVHCLAFVLAIGVLFGAVSAYAQDSVIVGPLDDPYVVYGTGLPTTYTPSKSVLCIPPPVDEVKITSIDPSRFPSICTSVEVLDPDGNPISGMDLDSFCVRQDGLPIDSFVVTETPIDSCFTSIALVIDVSGSMETGGKIDSAKAAAHAFVDNMDLYDRVAIVKFSDCFEVVQNFTSDKTLLHTKISSLVSGGFTAAFDGIWKGVDITKTEFGSKAVIALSDGMENRSWLCPGGTDGLLDGFADDSTIIVSLARGAGIPIYTISLGLSFDPRYLEALANGSGGFHSHAPTPSEIRGIYETIKFRLCSRYIICYASPDTILNGDCHTVEICNRDATGACVVCDTTEYCEPKPPRITMVLQEECHYANTPLEICAEVVDSDTPADSLDVKLFYRVTDLDPYTSVQMVHTVGDMFCYTLPAALFPSCLMDSVQFYGTASDGRTTVADPEGAPFDHYAIGICRGDPPICKVPNDTTIFQCDPQRVCLPVACLSVTGAPNGTPQIVSGPGTISDGNWCYTPSGDEVIGVTVACVDTCGNRCEASFRVAFRMNTPPVCTATSSTGSPLCVPPVHIVTFETSDVDNNLADCVLYGDGELLDHTWQMIAPQPGQSVSARVVCYDQCRDSCWIDINFTFPTPVPPVCTLPNDTTIVLCETEIDSLPVSATGGAVCEITAGPGELRNGYWVYEPAGSEQFSVTIECRTECDTCGGTFRVTYEVNRPPVLTCQASGSVECGVDLSQITILPPLIDDEHPGTVILSPPKWDTIPGNCENRFTVEITWIATDECGAADTCTDVIEVDDTTPPYFLACPDPISPECGTAYVMPPPTAEDNCDDDVDVTIVGTDSIPGNCFYSYTRIIVWEAMDNCGNVDTCRHVYNIVDHTPPFIECPDPLTFECDSVPASFPEPTATDLCDPNPVITEIGRASSTTSECPQGYHLTIMWEAMDACGNADTCTQVIDVVDTTPPSVTCSADTSFVPCGAAVQPAPPDATDNCDPDPIITMGNAVRTPDPECASGWVMVVPWEIADHCGNVAACTTIFKGVDNVPPSIACPPPSRQPCGPDSPPIPAPYVSDNCDPDPAMWLERIDTIPGSCPQNYTANLIWMAADTCGNVDSCTQVVEYYDDQPPTCDGIGHDPLYYDCDAVPGVFPTPQAFDFCDPDPVVRLNKRDSIPGNCPNTYSLELEWEYIDACQNASYHTQFVYVTDTTKPVITCPSDTTVADCVTVGLKDAAGVPGGPFLPYDYQFGEPSATDNCDPDPEHGLLRIETIDPNPCHTELRFTFGALDDCGNMAECYQTVYVIDTAAPVCSIPNDTAVFFCDPGTMLCLPVSATDVCDPNPQCRVVSGPGYVDAGRWCYNAVTDEVITVVVACRDRCDNECQGEFTVTIDVNERPSLSFIDPGPISLCKPGEICVTYVPSDPDDNITTEHIIDAPPGSVIDTVANTVCFTPTVEGLYHIDLEVMDSCGATDREVVEFSVKINQPPVCLIVPQDTARFFICEADSICTAALVSSDSDGNLDTCTASIGDLIPVAGAPWQWCYWADRDTTFTVVTTCTDTCGAECVDSFWVKITMNTPPSCSWPNDTTLFFCDESEICLPFTADDPDDNIVTCGGSIIGVDKTPIDGRVCFARPPADTTWLVYLYCEDACGARCEDTVEVHLNVNEAPVCLTPNDTTIFACPGDADSVVWQFTATDPDNNLDHCEWRIGMGPAKVAMTLTIWPGTFTQDTSLWVTTYCVDSCGLTCTDSFNVWIDVNDPPVCRFPDDISSFACEPGDTLWLAYSSSDPNGNLDSCTVVDGPGGLTETHWYYVVTVAEEFDVTMACFDACGAYCEGSFHVRINLNEPPFVEAPNDTTIFLCDPGDTICLGPWPQIDFNGNIMNRWVNFGWMDPPNVCFVADTPGVYIIDDCLEDSCGLIDCDTAIVIVRINQPPVCVVPNDTTIIVCDEGEVCLPIGTSDPDGNLMYCNIGGIDCKAADGCKSTGGEGKWCYKPYIDETVEVTVTCVDSCGATCESSFSVTFNIVEPPVCVLPDDSYIMVCEAGEVIELPISVDDPDQSLDSCFITSGPGALVKGVWQYTTSVTEKVCVGIACVGLCGEACVDSFCVTIRVNEPPFVESPGDTSFWLCNAGDTVCLGPWPQIDFDYNIAERFVHFGWMDPPSICFVADTAGVYTIDDCLTDSCGLTNCDTAYITIRINEPPVCHGPNDTTITMCQVTEVSLPYDVSDADGNLIGCDITEGPGVPANGMWVYTPPGDTTVCVTIECVDECKTRCISRFCVTFDVNHTPVCQVPADTLIRQCVPTEVRLPVSALDDDNNLVGCDLISGSGKIEDGYWIYTPAGDEAFCNIVRCIDECGDSCVSKFCVVFKMSDPPVCQLPRDTTIKVCNVEEICLPVGLVGDWKTVPGTGGDVHIPSRGKDDGRRPTSSTTVRKSSVPTTCTILSGPGYISSGQWCYTPPQRDTSVTVTVECRDTCGATCQGSFTVDFDFNEAPVCQWIDLSPPPPCPSPGAVIPMFFSSIDPDGDETRCTLYVDEGIVTMPDGFVQVEHMPGDSVDFTIVCKDPCGDSCVLTMAFRFPTIQPVVCPDVQSQKRFLCAAGPDSILVGGNCEVIKDGPGFIRNGWWVYTPAGDEVVNVELMCLGLCDTCYTNFSVGYDINEPPSCWVRMEGDTARYWFCEPEEICIPFGGSDPDENLVGCDLFSGPGTVRSGDGQFWCYTPQPATDETFEVTIRCVDECGAESFCSFFIDIDMNEPPICASPNDTTIFLCAPTEVCLPIGGATDPDNNLKGCYWIGDDLKNGGWCYYAETDETVPVITRCEDDCGAACEDTFYVTFKFNEAPVCKIPNDTTIFLCEPTELCFYPTTAIDPDGNLAHCGIYPDDPEKSALRGEEVCFFADRDTTVELWIYCFDSCSATCRGSFEVTVQMNQAPVCEFKTPDPPLCTPPVQVVFFSSTDPEGGKVTCTLDGPGELFDGGWQYIPTPGEQISVKITCTDACGATCTIGWDMTFPARVPPICEFPNDTTIVTCIGYAVSLPVGAGPGATCRITSGPGTIVDGYWQYTMTQEETVNVSILCVSGTGCDSCSGSFAVTLEKLPPPTLTFTGGADQSFFLCQPQQICLPYTAADGIGGPMYTVTIISGPATVDAQNSRICLTTTAAGTYTIITKVEDPCSSSRDTVVVHLTTNSPPVCNLPRDTTVSSCSAGAICLPVSATDVDGNLTGCAVTGGPGQISNGQWCYTPTASGPVTVTVTCTDACGATCSGSFTVNFNVQGSAPVCNFPRDTTILLCTSRQVCLPFSSTDPDGGTVTCVKTAGVGTLVDGFWCYTPPADQEVTATIRCTDPCGNYCEGTFKVLFDINDAPTLVVPEKVTKVVCGTDEFCIPITAGDQNGNLTSVQVVEGPGHISGNNWCYTPPAYDQTVNVKIRATDACGLTTQRWMQVVIDYNAVPACALPPNGRIILCAPGQLCLTFSEVDPASVGITCTVLDGPGTIQGGQWCYNATAPGVVEVSIRCTNPCGDVCTTTRTYTIEIDPNECVAGPAAVPTTPTVRVAGDLDNSGGVDVVDLVLLTRQVYRTPTPAVATAAASVNPQADVNCDGRVNAADVDYLAAFLFEDGPALCSGSATGTVPPVNESPQPAVVPRDDSDGDKQ